MKKYLSFVFATLFLAAMFISCGNKKTDEHGFFQDIDSAASQAQKKDKDIIVAITMTGDDMYSSSVMDNILTTEVFKNNVLSEFAVLYMDFSQSSYEKTVVNEEASKDEQKKAAAYADLMQKNSQLASLLNVQSTPAFYVLTKDKYFITELDFDDTVQTYESFAALLNSQKSVIQEKHSMVEATKKGSNLERISAIDALYDSTDVTYRFLFSDLIETVIKLDKNNESGLLSKYLLANADVKGSDFFMRGDAEGAAQTYIKVCDEPALLPEHKQQAYYMGAYILAMSGSTDYKAILEYLQKSIEAAPESENVSSIMAVAQYIMNSISALSEGALSSEN